MCFLSVGDRTNKCSWPYSHLSFSDYKHFMFTVDISCHSTGIIRPAKWSRVGLFGPTSVDDFSIAFNEACHLLTLDYLSNTLNVEEVLNMFNSFCTSVLDIVAPLRMKKTNKQKTKLNHG